IFIYGFVLIMILFTLMNIVNMMSASINKRKKEFAMMLSVGMSPKGIQKMILNESFIYGLKTLLYGVPLSILVEYWLYIQTYGQNNPDISFQISYIAYFISFIMIMFVMVITFRVGLRQLKKQNIIESLKDDM
ncbi:MAG: FtsX-like permease family protein, partial [Coprobacillus sp.]